MLFDVFKDLISSAPKEGVVLGYPVDEERGCWLAIDSHEYPALMLPTKEDDIRPDVVLRAVDVEFSRVCTFQDSGEQQHSGCFTIIRLKSDDLDIARLFLNILQARFVDVDPPESNSEIATSIQEIANLFCELVLSTRDTIGLWGELFVLSHSSALDSAVQSWTARKRAKYDFVTDSFVLDVKTALSETPKHRFSLEQIRPVGGFRAFIASVCVVEVPSGETLGGMMDRIVERIADAELRNSFLQTCLVKGGRDIYRSDVRLQAYPEPKSLRVFEAEQIPVPSISQSDPISNLKFDVDLSALEPLRTQALANVMRFSGGVL
ncbi:MAG: PD-(D/E)XK motif protein [Pseudomonadota bacterium]